MFTMTHYVTRNSDGSVHVTNAVGGMIGQHHVHTEDDFRDWADGREGVKPISPDAIKPLQATADCDCGLKPGEQKAGL